jgi:hypothetical protein
VLQRVDDLEADLLLDRIHAADIGESDARAFDLGQLRLSAVTSALAQPTVCVRVIVIVIVSIIISACHPDLGGENLVRKSRISRDRPAIGRRSACPLTSPREKPRIEEQGSGWRLGASAQALEHNLGMAMLALLIEGPRKSALQSRIIAPAGQRLAELALGFLGAAGTKQGIAEVLHKRQIVRGDLQRGA